jgi:two-component system, NtrC family, response regulator AtoC
MASDSSHSGTGTSRARSATIKQRLRILVVDDEPNVRGIITAHLNDEGHDVGTANDGAQALERFKAESWDLVMTDRVMPKMNGDELAKAIKALNPKIPVILVTAFADRPPDPEVSDSPFDLVIRKPFTRDTLRAAIALVRA